MPLPTPSLRDQVDKVAARLTDEYAGSVPDRVVRDLVQQSYQEMESARVTNFVPVLIDRTVRAKIRAGYFAEAV